MATRKTDSVQERVPLGKQVPCGGGHLKTAITPKKRGGESKQKKES